MRMKLDISNLVERLEFTDKAQLKIQDYSADLSGRERQFLLLKMRNDALSKKALERIIDKVDVVSLLSRGYLRLPELENKAEDVDDKLIRQVAEAVNNKNAKAGETNPVIELLSGNIN